MKEYPFAAVLTLCISINVLADPTQHPCPNQYVTFDEADANSDGMIFLKEMLAYPGWDRTMFNFADENQDGAIDRQEYEKLGQFVTCD